MNLDQVEELVEIQMTLIHMLLITLQPEEQEEVNKEPRLKNLKLTLSGVQAWEKNSPAPDAINLELRKDA